MNVQVKNFKHNVLDTMSYWLSKYLDHMYFRLDFSWFVSIGMENWS